MAYEIPPGEVENVTQHLDHREKGGYKAVTEMFYPQDSNVEPFELKIYIGTEDNPDYLGPAPLDDIAEQIFTSHGPSGPNTEYLFELVNIVRNMMPHVNDAHLFELEQKVKALMAKADSANVNVYSMSS